MQAIVNNNYYDLHKETDLQIKRQDVEFHPLTAEEFGDYVEKCHLSNNKNFEDQFAVILQYF